MSGDVTPTIWDSTRRSALAARVRTLTPAHTAKWGKFSVGGMVAHLNDGARMATGDLPIAGKGPVFLRWPPVRYLMIHVLPMPKNAPTAPELLARSSASDLAREQQAFATLLDGLARCESLAAEHPAFGSMTRDDWGVLIHKHIDHHLRQFGA
jgi:hypothetical protein